jgi:glycosyltransferase involved in cell wall biosynthesis
MVRLKGIHHLLDASAALQREGLSFSLVLIGDGPEREWIELRVRELNLQNVHLLPELPPDQMAGVYRSADFLVCPTLQDAWGLVVNEALLSGLPVLASRYAGCAAEILPAANVFDPTNHAELTLKLRRAITDGIPPPDASRLRPIREVAAMLVEDIKRTLAASAGAVPGV